MANAKECTFLRVVATLFWGRVFGLGRTTTVDLLPKFHFTRTTGHMNDPNGLLFMDVNGSPVYHMFFQSSHPDVPNCPGKTWGHTYSPDMVHWHRTNRSGICGNSGGAVALPNGTALHPDWRAVAFASIPDGPTASEKTEQAPVGLSMWFSTDENLMRWQVYKGEPMTDNRKGAPVLCDGTMGKLTAVICPIMVPNSTRAGYLGDNYVWVEKVGNNTTYKVLVGSNTCPKGEMWCGAGATDTFPQGLLFQSTDLIYWRFGSVFVRDPRSIRALYTPDTFPLPPVQIEDAQLQVQQPQALLWLDGDEGTTKWMVGNVSLDAGEGKPVFNVSAQGLMDDGDLICEQSLTDARGRRVQIGWVQFVLDGAPFQGVQSLPRVISLATHSQSHQHAAAPGDSTPALRFAPLPEISSLHSSLPSEQADLPQTTFSAGSTRDITGMFVGFTTHFHMQVLVTLTAEHAVLKPHHHATVSVLGGGQSGGVEVSIAVNSSVPQSKRSPLILTINDEDYPLSSFSLSSHDNSPINLPANSEVEVTAANKITNFTTFLDIFVDGAIVEVFANNGEVVRTLSRTDAKNDSLQLSASGLPAGFKFHAWKMNSAIVG